jgi:hypothetical protein
MNPPAYLWMNDLKSTVNRLLTITPEATVMPGTPASAALESDAEMARSALTNDATATLKPARSPATLESAAGWTAWRPPLILQLVLASLIAHIAMNGARITTMLYALSLQASQFTVGTLAAVFSCSQPNLLAPLHHTAPPGRGGKAVGIRATISNATGSCCHWRSARWAPASACSRYSGAWARRSAPAFR